MKRMNRKLYRGAWTAALVASGAWLASQSAVGDTPATPQGDQWETTSQMSMAGMPMQMPVQKLKICAARDRTEPPGSSREGCTNSNYSHQGNKVTWTTQCTKPSPMSGEGEIEYQGTDSYTGTMTFTSEAGAMTIKLTGHKTGATCSNPQ